MRSVPALAIVTLAATSCTRLDTPPELAPVPAPVPALGAEPGAEPAVEARPRLDPAPVVILRPGEDRVPDPILDSPWMDDPRFAREVERWIDVWTEREKRGFPVYLERMSAYERLVDEALAGRGLPLSLRYLPVIESGYSTTAVSRASAVGLWQLMAATARGSGMRVGRLVDERRDPVRSTRAATEYLAYLHERFDSWLLALAAYNAGPSRVARLLERRAPATPPSDDLYWLILEDLPRETRNFVPRFVAAARVAADPASYGFGPASTRSPFVYDEVSVPDATSLDVVARAAGVSEEDVAFLNPQILRRVTPDGVTTTLRVPDGTGWRFNHEYPRIPPGERVSVAEHVVESGETLWGIARRYGVRLAVLEEANPDVRPERLRPGDRLIVPLLPAS